MSVALPMETTGPLGRSRSNTKSRENASREGGKGEEGIGSIFGSAHEARQFCYDNMSVQREQQDMIFYLGQEVAD